ncbi:MAG: hydrogenase iron-sulfur subunit [Promethearchaeota archaeon]
MTGGKSNILVIGGGIAGISAALDLAENYNVYLVEKKASIGGKMAQLDKTFPTLDCSICILAPKMVEVSRHPNITLMTYSEVESVTPAGSGELFNVSIRKKARYVNEEMCTGCGECMADCPINIKNEFEAGALDARRKAIYIPFAQAIPRKAVIDKNVCLMLKRGKCGKCKDLCQRAAIDYDMKDELVDVQVASIVVATGYDMMDMKELKRYNYKRYPNIITSLQYERMLSASGPSMGHIVRPSDGKKPGSIGFILCAGSRNIKYCGYCSKFCCMYATKDAVLTKEHEPSIDVTLFYNDIRAIGKNHEEFIERAKDEYNVEYMRGIPGDVREDPGTHDLIVKHANLITGEVETRQLGLVILCNAVVPSEGTAELSKILGIGTNSFGFFKSRDPINELLSTRDGIFLVGSCQSPDDISNSVSKAHGAAALAAERATPLTAAARRDKKVVVREIPVLEIDEPRIGVFLCHCGSNIGGYVDMARLLEYVKGLDNVVYASTNLYTCSSDTQEIIKDQILEHHLNRIVVAACTPRTHEKLFQDTMAEVGLNPYLLSFVSIRELDSWVHMKLPEDATLKAMDLVRMGISRSRLLKPLKGGTTAISPSSTVIGGGVAGMSAALTMASHGMMVHLVEKNASLGGFLQNLARVNFDQLSSKDLIDRIKNKLEGNKHVKVYLNSTIDNVSGTIGDYKVAIKSATSGDVQEVGSGTIIVATGIHEAKLKGVLGYGSDDRILTQQEFESLLEAGCDFSRKNVTFIHCAGSRGHAAGKGGVSYCSLYCCQVSVSNALAIKQSHPDANVFVLYRDIRVGTDEEPHYWRARKNVNYIRFDGAKYPTVTVNGADSPIDVRVFDLVTQVDLLIPSDYVVLNMPMVPAGGNKSISEILKVPLGPNGFFLEAHIKLRPLDFATDGVFVAGTAQGPKNIRESIAQGFGAGSRALTYMLRGEVETEPIIARVDASLCIGCGECEDSCSYGAIGLKILEGGTVSEVNPSLCKGCGTCAATCPAHAISINHFEYSQVYTQVEESLKSAGKVECRIVAFLCNWCSYAGADNAGVSRFQYPPEIRPIRVMCSGRVDPEFVLKAFLNGADGVLVTGCHIGDCHYIAGNHATRDRLHHLKQLLPTLGIDPGRLRLEWVSASEGKKFAEVVESFVGTIKELGTFGSERALQSSFGRIEGEVE